MLREEIGFEYKDFLKEYVISPMYDVTISFKYKNRIYQFDFVGVPKNKNGSTAYDFVEYEFDWNSDSIRTHYKSLKEAIEKAKIDGKSFAEIYNEPESEIIDIS